MYLIPKNEELDTIRLGSIIQNFQTRELPKITKWFNYYDGLQAILQKISNDESKKYNQVVVNFCSYIVDTYCGYLTGIPVAYSGNNFDAVLDILKYNDYTTEDSELLRQGLIAGRSFEINYVDEEGQQRFKVLDSRSCIPVYDNTLNNELQYVIRFWDEDINQSEVNKSYLVEVYGPDKVTRYKSGAGFSTFEFIEERPYFFGQCPITVFSLNADEKSIFDKVISLQNAYNNVVSDSIDNFDAFADAYLVLTGMTADEDSLADMKKNRVLLLDEGCDADYLIKEVNDAETQNTLKNLKDNIHKIANCPDFTDENFMTQSGIALRYKLVGFETSASGIANNFKKALQRRLELICSILNLTDGETTWRDADIDISRNLPTDMTETVQIVNQLRGIVSQETLLAQIPFVDDVKAEMRKVKKEKEENMSLYSLGVDNEQVLTDKDDEEQRETAR